MDRADFKGRSHGFDCNGLLSQPIESLGTLFEHQTVKRLSFRREFLRKTGALPFQRRKMPQAAARIINIETWKDWQASGRRAQLVDVRSATEFATAHLPGAVNIPLEQIESRTADLETNTPVVLVCQGGTRARLASELLAASGKDLVVLEGGTGAWLQAGNPAVRSTASRWALERQVRLAAGLLGFIGVVLAVTVSPWWLILPGFVGCGLIFAGCTGFCPMGEVLARLPWNRPRRSTH
jgi:rhodanese-related sulfurtransferase